MVHGAYHWKAFKTCRIFYICGFIVETCWEKRYYWLLFFNNSMPNTGCCIHFWLITGTGSQMVTRCYQRFTQKKNNISIQTILKYIFLLTTFFHYATLFHTGLNYLTSIQCVFRSSRRMKI